MINNEPKLNQVQKIKKEEIANDCINQAMIQELKELRQISSYYDTYFNNSKRNSRSK